jgi:hypothetical protein
MEDAIRSEIQISYDIFPEASVDLILEPIADEVFDKDDEDAADGYDEEE